MAIVQNPLIGNAKNTFGNVIYQHYFNKNIIRSKPLVYHDANTFKQRVVREFMKELTEVGSLFTELLKYNLRYVFPNINYWNAWNKLNYNSAYIDEEDFRHVDYSLLKFSLGTLQRIELNNIQHIGNNTLRFTFDDIRNVRQYYNVYNVQILVFDDISKRYTYTSFLDAKNNNIFDFSISNLNLYTNIRIYYYFHTTDYIYSDARRFSNTYYQLFND